MFVFCILIEAGYSSPVINGEFDQKKKLFIRKHGDLTVENIVINGLEKTKPLIIIEECSVKPGQSLSGFQADNFVQNLRRTNIFRHIDIIYTQNRQQVIITVKVKEKWTLIPLPIVTSDGESVSFGFFLLDTNFLGYNKTVITGGTYSGSGFSGQLGYMDPAIAYSNFVLSAFVFGGKKIFQNSDSRGNDFQKYQATQGAFSCSLGYRLNNAFTLSLTGEYRAVYVSHDYDDKMNDPESGKSCSQGMRFMYQNIYYSGFFNYGLAFSAEYSYGSNLKGYDDQYHKSLLWLSYSLKAFEKHLFKFYLSGFACNAPDIYKLRTGGQSGSKTLPMNKIAADYFVSGTVLYEIPLYKFKYVNLTVPLFYEQGELKNEGQDIEHFYGPGAGLRLYLKRISIPAMGVDVAWNIETGDLLYSVAVGMSF